MTLAKIERWRQTPKNRILLENYYLPGGPQAGLSSLATTDLPAKDDKPAALTVRFLLL